MLMAIFMFLITFNYLRYNNRNDFINFSYYYILFISFGYVAMNFLLLIFPQILYGLPFEVESIYKMKFIPQEGNPHFGKKNEEVLEYDELASLKKNAPLFYSPGYIIHIKDLLESSKEKKQFLQSNFMIEHIMIDSVIPVHHISYYFNNIIKLKFAEWRNELRIKYAIELMGKGTMDSVNFKWIATNAGFSSTTTFFRAFKNHTTYTPSEYLLSLKD